MLNNRANYYERQERKRIAQSRGECLALLCILPFYCCLVICDDDSESSDDSSENKADISENTMRRIMNGEIQDPDIVTDSFGPIVNTREGQGQNENHRVNISKGDFRDHAKVYEWMKNKSNWVEKYNGIVSLNVNKNKITSEGNNAILNHSLQKEMILKSAFGSEKSFIYKLKQKNQGQESEITYALKFETLKIAEKFKNTFEAMVENLKENEASPSTNISVPKSQNKDRDIPLAGTVGQNNSAFDMSAPPSYGEAMLH